MGILNNNELTIIRNGMERGGEVDYTKPTINAAAQAIDGLLSGDTLIERTDVPQAGVGLPQIFSVVIDAATSPLTLTAIQKRRLVAFVLERKFQRDK